MSLATFIDECGEINVVIFPRVYSEVSKIMYVNKYYLLEGKIEVKETISLIANNLDEMNDEQKALCNEWMENRRKENIKLEIYKHSIFSLLMTGMLIIASKITWDESAAVSNKGTLILHLLLVYL